MATAGFSTKDLLACTKVTEALKPLFLGRSHKGDGTSSSTLDLRRKGSMTLFLRARINWNRQSQRIIV